MLLAGIAVPVEHVAELCVALREAELDSTADRLDSALADGDGTVALTVRDREALLRVLCDADGEPLAALRGGLLAEHVERRRLGL